MAQEALPANGAILLRVWCFHRLGELKLGAIAGVNHSARVEVDKLTDVVGAPATSTAPAVLSSDCRATGKRAHLSIPSSGGAR